jgi:ABC-type branched-subunit amino acid transport system substrate-binding protein
MEMITEYALSVLGMHHFGVIYPSNPRGRGLAEAFCEAVKSHAGTVEAKISIPEADPTLKDCLYPLTRQRLDGIFIPASAEEIVMVAPQLRYCGVKSRILGVEEFMDPILREHGADYIEGAVFAGPARIEPIDEARFYESYRARNRREPSELAGLGYDAGRLIFSQLKGEYSRSSLRDRIEKMGGYQGICGRLSWQHPKDAYKIYTIKDGLIEELKG